MFKKGSKDINCMTRAGGKSLQDNNKIEVAKSDLSHSPTQEDLS